MTVNVNKGRWRENKAICIMLVTALNVPANNVWMVNVKNITLKDVICGRVFEVKVPEYECTSFKCNGLFIFCTTHTRTYHTYTHVHTSCQVWKVHHLQHWLCNIIRTFQCQLFPQQEALDFVCCQWAELLLIKSFCLHSILHCVTRLREKKFPLGDCLNLCQSNSIIQPTYFARQSILWIFLAVKREVTGQKNDYYWTLAVKRSDRPKEWP